MSNRIRCPACDSDDVACVTSTGLVHRHECHACGHTNQPQPGEVALAEAADWIVHTVGIPVDMSTDKPPPLALLNAIMRVVHSDRTGNLHGNELSFAECVAWVNEEARWQEPTP